MTKENILEKLQSIFESILDEDEFTLTPETTVKDIDDWDSLSHIQIITEIETEYKLDFTSMEIGQLKEVGKIIDLVYSKIAN